MNSESLNPSVMDEINRRIERAHQAEAAQKAAADKRNTPRPQPVVQQPEAPSKPRRSPQNLQNGEAMYLPNGKRVLMVNGTLMEIKTVPANQVVRTQRPQAAPASLQRVAQRPRPVAQVVPTVRGEEYHDEPDAEEYETARPHSKRGRKFMAFLAVATVAGAGWAAYNNFTRDDTEAPVSSDDSFGVVDTPTNEQDPAATLPASDQESGGTETAPSELPVGEIDYTQVSAIDLKEAWEETCISGQMGTFIRTSSTTDIILQTLPDEDGESMILNPFVPDKEQPGSLRNPQMWTSEVDFTACPESNETIKMTNDGIVIDLSTVALQTVPGSGYTAPGVDEFTLTAGGDFTETMATTINEGYLDPELRQNIAGFHYQATMHEIPDTCADDFTSKLQAELTDQVREEAAISIAATSDVDVAPESIPVSFVGELELETSADYLVSTTEDGMEIINSLETHPISEAECNAIPHK